MSRIATISLQNNHAAMQHEPARRSIGDGVNEALGSPQSEKGSVYDDLSCLD